MKNIINIGVLGCANIAKRSIIPAILDLPEKYNLKGIASRSKVSAEDFAIQFKTESYTGYDTLLANDELDVVYIPLPNSIHVEWIEKALDRNLHVLVEKSMGCSYVDVCRINNIALKKNLVLVENFQFRFHKQLSIIKKMVTDEKIGELRCIRSSFGFPPFNDKNNIRYQKALGGGALYDAGAYPVKIAQVFMDNDIVVKASSLYFDYDLNVDIWGGAYLQQKGSNLFAEIAFGFDNYYQCSLELWGSKGKITANRIFTATPSFIPEITIETEEKKEVITVDEDNHFKNMMVYLYNLINTHSIPHDEYEQNIQQARILEAIRNQANV